MPLLLLFWGLSCRGGHIWVGLELSGGVLRKRVLAAVPLPVILLNARAGEKIHKKTHEQLFHPTVPGLHQDSEKPFTHVSKRVPGVHGKRGLERGWQKRLAKGWRKIG